MPLTILIVLIIIILLSSFVTVRQGYVAVITVFGKYSRIMGPGLNMRVPLIEVIHRRISIQNRSVELEFQAVTQDQANVYFKAMLLYAVFNQAEATIKNVAFKFVDLKTHLGRYARILLRRQDWMPSWLASGNWRPAPGVALGPAVALEQLRQLAEAAAEQEKSAPAATPFARRRRASAPPGPSTKML